MRAAGNMRTPYGPVVVRLRRFPPWGRRSQSIGGAMGIWDWIVDNVWSSGMGRRGPPQSSYVQRPPMRRDETRLGLGKTGVYVRALTERDTWISCDVAHLSKQSLKQWLCYGGDNRLAEDLCGVVLGHGRLHVDDD